MKTDGTKRFWGKCRACAHAWIVARLPMPIEEFVETARRNGSHCPACGDHRVFCGPTSLRGQ
jgi:hypothetical protein